MTAQRNWDEHVRRNLLGQTVDLDPDEARAAGRAVCVIAERRGASREEAAAVLAMLGITEVLSPKEAK